MYNYPPKMTMMSWRTFFMVIFAVLSCFTEPILQPSFLADLRCKDESLDYKVVFGSLEWGGHNISLLCGEEYQVNINTLSSSWLSKLNFSFRIIGNVIALYLRQKQLGQNRMSRMAGIAAIMFLGILEAVPFLITSEIDGFQKFNLIATNEMIVNIILDNVYNITMFLFLCY